MIEYLKELGIDLALTMTGFSKKNVLPEINNQDNDININ